MKKVSHDAAHEQQLYEFVCRAMWCFSVIQHIQTAVLKAQWMKSCESSKLHICHATLCFALLDIVNIVAFSMPILCLYHKNETCLAASYSNCLFVHTAYTSCFCYFSVVSLCPRNRTEGVPLLLQSMHVVASTFLRFSVRYFCFPEVEFV